MSDAPREVQLSEDPRGRGGPGRPAPRERLRRLINTVWPGNAPTRAVAGLPAAVADILARKRRRGPFGGAAAGLDRLLPGWPEACAAAVAEAAGGVLAPELERACALLGRRPLRRPGPLLGALAGLRHDADARFWLLVALAGTDTAAVRAAWRQTLDRQVDSCAGVPDRVLWLGFLRAFMGGWLTWGEFRGCLTRGRVLAAAHPSGDYRRSLGRLGLSEHPVFSKWYRQVVYEIAGRPEAPLSMEVGGWIRDFPGEAYLWDALAQLQHNPDAWWPLHTLRWVSGLGPASRDLVARLHGVSPAVAGLVSLIRPDLCPAVASALRSPDHPAAVEWLRTTSANRTPDMAWVEDCLRPWAETAGQVALLAAEALCSVTPPPDFAGPDDDGLRRRAFIQRCLVPDIERFLDNLCYVHALRREDFAQLRRHAGRGRPAAVRALALWPEKAAEAAPLLFRVTRVGTGAARRAARESLSILSRDPRVAQLGDLERRVDLAAAWSDADPDRRPARVWWDVGGYCVRLYVAGGDIRLEVYNSDRRLAGIPRAVREDARYEEIRAARAQFTRSYRYFRERFENGMVEGVRYSGREFTTLLASPVVRSLASRLVIVRDGAPSLWAFEDLLGDGGAPGDFRTAESVWVAHPVELARRGALAEWQERIVKERVAQPFRQLFREIYPLGEEECAALSSTRFAGHSLIARRAFAILRRRGYSPRQGDAAREWQSRGLRAHIQWANPEEPAGRLAAQPGAVETVTSGPVWFEDSSGKVLPLGAVCPVVRNETLRDADLLVSRAFAGELGFTSTETRRVRAALVRYLARALGLTTVYVGEDENHALVEGQRALYRVHLGSGTVVLEESRRGLDVRAVADESIEALVSESMDSGTARILSIIRTLSRDEDIAEGEFLRQLEGRTD